MKKPKEKPKKYINRIIKMMKHLDRGEHLEAIKLAEERVALYPKFPASWTGLAFVHMKAGDLTKAQAANHQAIKRNPEWEAAWSLEAEICEAQGKPKDALVAYIKTDVLAPTYLSLYNVRRMAVATGDIAVQDAAEKVILSLAKNPAIAWRRFAEKLIKVRMDAAEAILREVLAQRRDKVAERLLAKIERIKAWEAAVKKPTVKP